MDLRGGFVLEVDLQKFFDTLDHGYLEFPTESGRSIKCVIVHARSVTDVEEISKA